MPKKAISENNVNIVLKWIPEANEAEIKDAFIQTMKVRVLSHDAEKLADKSFSRPSFVYIAQEKVFLSQALNP